MGHGARKKKKRGGAGRKAAKDHAAQLEGDQTALTDELTALLSLFLRKTQVFKNNMNMPAITRSNALYLSRKQVSHKRIL